MEMFKKCQICFERVHRDDYTKDKSKKDGLSIYCIYCRRRKDKSYKLNNTERIKSYRKKHRNKASDKIRNYALKRRYGITLDKFYEMLENQGYRCKLCDSEKSDNKNFAVDHNHIDGKIRGILCSYCNRALGMFRDDINLLRKAIEYLRGNL